MGTGDGQAPRRKWFSFKMTTARGMDHGGTETLARWNMWMLNDKETIAVPGMVAL